MAIPLHHNGQKLTLDCSPLFQLGLDRRRYGDALHPLVSKDLRLHGMSEQLHSRDGVNDI